MRGRYLVAAVLVLVCMAVWAQEADTDADAETIDPIIIVVEPDDAVLIIGDDTEEDRLPDIVFRNTTDYIGEDEDFIIEWGETRQSVSRRIGEYEGVEYRTVPINISVFTPFEIFPFPNKQVVGLAVSVLYGATASVIGIQAGVVNHVYDRLYGIQVGAVNLSNGTTYGLRVAWLFNTGERHGGFSLSASGNRYTEDGSWGLMVGGYNQTGSFTGLQIGVLNVCTDLRGVQIGAINVNQSGKLRIMPGINVGW